MKAKTVLVYGFGWWGSMNVNIAEKVVGGVAHFPGLDKQILRVRFNEDQFLDMVQEHEYDYVLGMGRYPKGKKIRIEQHGFNRKKLKNTFSVIEAGGLDTYPVTWEIKPLEGMEVTDDPGAFVCNYSMYILGKWANDHGVKYAFLHIPKDFSEERAIRIIDTVLREQVT